MTTQSSSITSATRQITAYALPRNWQSAKADVVLKTADFVLVSTTLQYKHVIEVMGQPILITRKFSVTDSRGSMRLLLGGLIEPWRWRRALLNENITSLRILRGEGSWVFRIAAILSRTRYTNLRMS
jgi:hypothetical protein